MNPTSPVESPSEPVGDLRLPNSSSALAATISGWMALVSPFVLAVLILIAVRQHSASGSRGSVGPGFAVVLTGIILSSLMVICCPLIWWSCSSDANRVREFRRNLQAGKYLVRWRYDAGQWAAFKAFVFRTKWRWRWDLLVIGLLMIVPPVLAQVAISGAVSRGERAADLADLRSTAWSIVLWAEIGLLFVAGICEFARRSWRKRLENNSVTVIGTLCAYANGHWVLWGTAGRVLSGVTVVGGTGDEPLRLVITTNNGQADAVEEILVPAGQREIAERVAAAIVTSPESKRGGGLATTGNVMQAIVSILRIFR